MTSPSAQDDLIFRQQAALVALSRSEVIQSGDLDRALRQLTRTAAEVLDVVRVGVWRLSRDPVAITSLMQYDLRAGQYEAGAAVAESTCPAYFRAIASSDIVAADDARIDPRTSELDASYLRPLGITSMMDVPVYGPDGRWGVLCHEHVGAPREWRRDEQMFALGIANLVSAAVGSAGRHGAEQRLKAYLENASDCMVVMGPDSRVAYANKAWHDVMKYTPADLAAGISMRSLVSEESQERSVALLERLLRGEPVRFQQMGLTSRDGRRVLADGSAWAQMQGGKPQHLFAHWRDATAEHERQTWHRYFLDQSAGMYHYGLREPMPVTLSLDEQLDWILKHNYLVECNAAHARFFGFSTPADMAGHRFQDTYANVEDAKDLLRVWIRNGYRIENVESRERTATGGERWFLGFGTGVVQDGHLVESFGMRLDITDRKLSEQALRESEEKFRQFAENIRDVFWMMDLKDERFIFVSSSYETVFGRPADAMYEDGEDWLEVVHPEDRLWVRKAYYDRGRREPFDIVYRILRGDETIGWIHDRGFPISDPGGKPYRLVGVAEDVTEVKKSEGALRESEKRLAEALRSSEDRVIQLEDQVRDRQKLERLVGKSDLMQDVYRRVRLAAQSDVTALITGESGTGKELVAAAIHSLSSRGQKPYVAVNCTAIPEALLESEIFGHVKGAFTGAARDRHGLLQAAEGGTLFLDEIGDMPATLQAKLLRVLQERVYRRVGDEQEVRCDVRIVAATNRDLAAAVSSGDMREDFFYRIRVFEIILPALRERREDIPLLVGHLIEELSQQTGRKVRGVTAEAMRALVAHGWPGNVRELRNALEHGFVTSQGDHLRGADLPPEIGASAGGGGRTELSAEGMLERRRLEDALRRAKGNRGEAAKLMGISRVTFWKRMQKYGVQDP